MPLIDGPDGPVEVLVAGRGDPVTVFAHGLASSIAETRPFGSGVLGTRVFLHFRGHGEVATPSTRLTYAALQAELMAVATAYGASRALGVSLGAGALLRAAWSDPAAFDRLVFVLPSTIDVRRHDSATRRRRAMADLIERGNLAGLAGAIVTDQSAGARGRPEVARWAAHQAERLIAQSLRDGGLTRALRELPGQPALDAATNLSSISCPVLVIGQELDDAHPVSVARELADRLPKAQLRVFDGGGLVWAHRDELRDILSTFLNVTPLAEPDAVPF